MKRNWIERRRRGWRFIRIKILRAARASELRVLADPLPERGDRERETGAFWFRRITTAILFGNAAGIVTLASYVASVGHTPEISRLAYPAMASFLSGTLLGFISYAISFISASMRFEAYVGVMSRAFETAKKAGKASAATQHDSVFVFLIFLVVVQGGCLLYSSFSFYSGSTYVLSVLGEQACKGKNDDFCYRTHLLFPSLAPYRVNTGDKLEQILLQPSDFKLNVSDIDGSIFSSGPAEIKIIPPSIIHISGVMSITTVQLTSPRGEYCIYRMSWYSDGVGSIAVTNVAREAHERLMRRGYRLTPIRLRLFINSLDGKSKKQLTIVDSTIGFRELFPSELPQSPAIALMPIDYDEILGFAIVSDGEAEDTARCLLMAEAAGFYLGQKERQLAQSFAAAN